MSIKNILNNDKKLDRIARLAFQSVDKDGSGLIDIRELELVMVSISKDLRLDPPSKQEIKEVFNMLDSDQSGNISYKEFKVLIRCVLESLV
jgi:Ca2+-binding EF-hand superfamily protein